MKNKKLNLDELKVKSFVTDLENGKENTVKGGIITILVATAIFGCYTFDGCYNSDYCGGGGGYNSDYCGGGDGGVGGGTNPSPCHYKKPENY